MTAIGNTLYLDKIKRNDVKLGETGSFNDKDVEKMIELNFYKVESLDILILKLKSIKNNIIVASAS